MTRQLDLRGVTDTGEATPGKVAVRPFVPPHDDRPPYAVADDWDRMVRVIRARDRLRPFGVIGVNAVVVPGPHPRLASVLDPEIWTDL